MSTVPERLSAALADRYALERQLGEGGMATVYLAHDVKHDRRVAIKVLRPELAAVIGAERFLAEIRTTANLQHPHILPLFDSGEADGFLWYVMPYVHGETLRDRLGREGQLPVDEVVAITRAVAGALDHAHRQGVVHRDIKPANVLLLDGQPVVADFGIALAVSASGGGRMTETGLSLGTPHYMSPEQATGDRAVDGRSDVYSLACVAYECLTGVPPHTASTAQAVVAKILTEEAPRVTQGRRTVPANVAGALQRALEKLPADRFATAADFQRALEDGGYRYEGAGARHPARVLRGSVARTVLAMALAVAVTALVMRAIQGDSPGNEIGPASFAVDVEGRRLRSDLVVSADGSALAFVQGGVGLLTRRIHEPDFRMVREGRVLYPTLSPDGEWVAFLELSEDLESRRILRMPVGGGPAVTLLDSDSIRPFDPFWGEDGTIVFMSLGDRSAGTYRMPAAGGAAPERISGFTGRNPHILPDGSGVLLTRTQTSVGVHLLELGEEGYPTQEIIPDGADASYVRTGHILYGAPEGALMAVSFDLGSHRVGDTPVLLLDDIGSEGLAKGYAASQNGMLVYSEGEASFQGRTRRQLVLVDPEGGRDTLRGVPGYPVDVRLSPDGGRAAIALSSVDEAALILYDLVTSAVTPVVAGRAVQGPVWSPDGARIAYSALGAEDDGQDLDVWVADADGSDERRVVSLAGREAPAAWPVPDRLVFTAYRQRNREDILTVSPEGGEPAPYLTAAFGERSPTVSPDGRWLAYVADEDGDGGDGVVDVRGFPEPGASARVADAGASPRWSPDGSRLYYWARSVGSGDGAVIAGGLRYRLLAVDVDPGPPPGFGPPREIASGQLSPGAWDVHPDGRRLLLVESVTTEGAPEDGTGSARNRQRVITDFFTLVRQRFGEAS